MNHKTLSEQIETEAQKASKTESELIQFISQYYFKKGVTWAIENEITKSRIESVSENPFHLLWCKYPELTPTENCHCFIYTDNKEFDMAYWNNSLKTFNQPFAFSKGNVIYYTVITAGIKMKDRLNSIIR